MKCQSCQAISVLDPDAAGAELRVLRLGAARALRGDEARVPARERAAVQGQRDRRRATASARWYGRLWLAPGALKRSALTDTVRGVYLPYWTFDAPRRRRRGPPRPGHYYYTTETYVENGQTRTRQVRHVRWEPAAGPRCSTSSTTTSSARRSASTRRCCAASSRSRPASSSPTTPATSPAGSSSATRSTSSPRRSARARRWTRKVRGAVRAAGSRRHLPQPRRARRLVGADVQAHPRAGVAAVVHLRRARRTSA